MRVVLKDIGRKGLIAARIGERRSQIDGFAIPQAIKGSELRTCVKLPFRATSARYILENQIFVRISGGKLVKRRRLGSIGVTGMRPFMPPKRAPVGAIGTRPLIIVSRKNH